MICSYLRLVHLLQTPSPPPPPPSEWLSEAGTAAAAAARQAAPGPEGHFSAWPHTLGPCCLAEQHGSPAYIRRTLPEPAERSPANVPGNERTKVDAAETLERALLSTCFSEGAMDSSFVFFFTPTHAPSLPLQPPAPINKSPITLPVR